MTARPPAGAQRADVCRRIEEVGIVPVVRAPSPELAMSSRGSVSARAGRRSTGVVIAAGSSPSARATRGGTGVPLPPGMLMASCQGSDSQF